MAAKHVLKATERTCDCMGQAISQVVSRWLSTAAVRIRPQGWSSVIYRGQSGAGADFLRVLRFPLPIFIPPNFLSLQSPGRHAEWTQYGLHPPLCAIKNLILM
jgi:hypothetical protein